MVLFSSLFAWDGMIEAGWGRDERTKKTTKSWKNKKANGQRSRLTNGKVSFFFHCSVTRRSVHVPKHCRFKSSLPELIFSDLAGANLCVSEPKQLQKAACLSMSPCIHECFSGSAEEEPKTSVSKVDLVVVIRLFNEPSKGGLSGEDG